MGIFAIYIGYFTHQVYQMDIQYEKWNNNEWHIDGFSRPIFLIRFINAQYHSNIIGGGGNNMILAIMRKTIIKPALHKVTSLMEQADIENIVPKILCNTEAQTDLTQRVEQYYNDIQSSQTLTITGKILLYALSYMCLTNHYGLLTLGMKAEVQHENIVSPVFIASLPRTGSTILHRTMSLDTTRFRTFDLADVIQPLVSSSSQQQPKQPIPRWDKTARAQNANSVTQILNQIKLIYPGHMECLETLHSFRPNEADEDLGWYNNALGHPYMDALMKLYPQYQKRHLNDTIESAHVAKYRYAWLSMIMKIYQYNDRIEWERRKYTEGRSFLREYSRPSLNVPWLMKDPNHSAYLPELISEFPDAKLIFTHRHPADVIPSLAKLFVVFTAPEVIPGTPGSSAKEWGEETLRRIKLNGIVEFTEAQNNNSGPYSFSSGNDSDGKNDNTFRIDLSFEDVTQDVVGAITKIYKKLYPDQSDISNTAMSAFKKYLEKNEREKYGNQRRSLEDFHLTKDDVEFREYNDMFLTNGQLH